MSQSKAFIRYIVISPVGLHWWEQLAAPFLQKKGWVTINPENFSYKSSYGFDPNVTPAPNQLSQIEYSLRISTAVVEYRGEPIFDSVFVPDSNYTVIDDLLAFMSLYTGRYWQYMWREYGGSTINWTGSFALEVSCHWGLGEQAGERDKALSFFEKALATIPNLDKTQLALAIAWFFSALREFEVRRPLVEAALNWVCLESQANYLRLAGNKLEKAKSLLARQGFPPAIPRLEDLYRLRNDAFHDGKLSKLSEPDAEAARTAGRALVRAQILNLIGMSQPDFRDGFVKLYAT
jgi:tetratricopeptide (TPR) repeat protein